MTARPASTGSWASPASCARIGVVILAFVGLTVLLIVINSIRMALMSRAQEIEIMRLVGASDRYVRWPFIIEGLLIGVIGSGVTLLLPLARVGAHQRPRARDRRPGAGRLQQSLTTQLSLLVVVAGLGLGGLGARSACAPTCEADRRRPGPVTGSGADELRAADEPSGLMSHGRPAPREADEPPAGGAQAGPPPSDTPWATRSLLP